MLPFAETVTIVNPGIESDRYSTETRESWADSDITTHETSAAVEPRPSQEPGQDARNAVVSGYTIYLTDSEVPVSARSRVEVRGGTFRVEGEPAVWRSPYTGEYAGTVVQVERTEG